jgi:hypothetical protein
MKPQPDSEVDAATAPYATLLLRVALGLVFIGLAIVKVLTTSECIEEM